MPLALSPSRVSDVTVTLAGALPSPAVVLLKLAATWLAGAPAYVMPWTSLRDQALAKRSATRLAYAGPCAASPAPMAATR